MVGANRGRNKYNMGHGWGVFQMFLLFLLKPHQWRSQEGGGERTLPLENEKSSNNFFDVKNFKTLKGDSLFVSVNSEPTVA